MAPDSVNVDQPSPARVYDYWLGGKDNYPADREVGDKMATVVPDLRLMARANRDFLVRSVQVLAGEYRISQFLDIGSGLPAAQPVHEVAQAINPCARVVYVDNDIQVASHSRALLKGNREGRAEFILGDVRDPKATILDHPALPEVLDLGKPVGVMLLSMLMYFDNDVAHQLIDTVMGALPSGSFLTISFPTGDFDPHTAARAIDVAAEFGLRYRVGGRAEVTELFDALELLEPGVVPLLGWRPGKDRLREVSEHRVFYYAGMARKP
jgi:hypothetical protein